MLRATLLLLSACLFSGCGFPYYQDIAAAHYQPTASRPPAFKPNIEPSAPPSPPVRIQPLMTFP